MRSLLVWLSLVGCTSASDRVGDVPSPPGKSDDSAFRVTGAKAWYLAGNALTPGDREVELAITGPATTGVVDVWLDRQYAGRADRTSDGFHATVALDEVAIGEHQILLQADEGEFAFAELRFHKSHPLYVAVSNDWDDPDNDDPMLERQERLHARHPELVLTHFVGPYTFTDPALSDARKRYLAEWVSRLARDEGDEIGLHVHPWCHFVRSAGVTCRTSPSFAYATGDTSGYTVILSSYTEAELEQLFAHARALFVANGLPAPTSFRAGGWTAEPHVLQALANEGHVADSSGCNWSRLEEWQGHTGAVLYNWNREHWSFVTETTQPYYPVAGSLDPAATGARLPLLEVPDNGLLVDYVSGSEMIDMFGRNFPDGAALTEPRVYAIGYHPPNFSETYFSRIDQALTEIDRHLASAGDGPVIYARMSDLPRVFGH